ncbi:dienelactone hydrolase family protein [Amycolatopsis sp.]|uniref:dienelactone hydrolase family protein n=1 Tax=Amycolatopsis sp. TaxID=37632 RepID=UPI002C98F53C|nr:dienelactone hydrolase family protein [Amycolatopsis sp.]HVV11680.1 dienelactone hydrolase family protein [Amycolatopsis sp.]
MAELVLFHHAQGLTPGCLAFAEDLRAGRHVVHTPDLYEGQVFPDLDSGMAYAREARFGTILDRGRAAADELPADVFYGGFSLGVLPAQMLAQTRPGALGALLMHSAIPLAEFGGAWPSGVGLQIHTMESDELGDVDEAKGLAAAVDDAELFLYPGSAHLFTDRSLPAYAPREAASVLARALDFLG